MTVSIERSTNRKNLKELTICGFGLDYHYSLIVENNIFRLHKVNLKNDDENHIEIKLPTNIKKEDIMWLFDIKED